VTLVVPFQETPGCFELGVVSNAGKDIQQFSLGWRRVPDAVRRKKRQVQGLGKPHRSLIAALFGKVAVSLQVMMSTPPAKHSSYSAGGESSTKTFRFMKTKSEELILRLGQIDVADLPPTQAR
jgi:hypothetical protein